VNTMGRIVKRKRMALTVLVVAGALWLPRTASAASSPNVVGADQHTAAAPAATPKPAADIKTITDRGF
jgi:hypothetical protein